MSTDKNLTKIQTVFVWGTARWMVVSSTLLHEVLKDMNGKNEIMFPGIEKYHE